MKKWGRQHPDNRIIFPPSKFCFQFIEKIEFSVLPLYKNRDFLLQKYTVEKLGIKEISRQISSSPSTVLKYLKLFKIPVREVGANITRKRGLPYGVKSIKKKEVDHERELGNILKMRELRDKGYSYHKIAEIFNSMKISTKTRKGKWHARAVQKILSRDVT